MLIMRNFVIILTFFILEEINWSIEFLEVTKIKDKNLVILNDCLESMRNRDNSSLRIDWKLEQGKERSRKGVRVRALF